MKPPPLYLLLGLLATSACSSDVDLQLGVPGGPDPNPLGHLDWATMDPGPLFGHDLSYDIEWAPDGSLVALFDKTNYQDVYQAGVRGYSSDGELLWQVTIDRALDGTSDLYLTELEATADGPLVAGWFYGTIDLGGGPIEGAGYKNGFLAAYDPAGELSWVRVFRGTRISSLRVLPDGGSLMRATDGAAETVFIERLDAAGTSVWRLDEPGLSSWDLLVRDGKVLFGGWLLGSEGLAGEATRYVSAVSLADGQPEWTTTFEVVGEGSHFGGGPMIATEEGHLLVAATLIGVVKAGSFELASASDDTEIAVVEMDLDGNVVGARQIAADDGRVLVTSIAPMGDHLAVVGQTDRSVDGVDLGKGQRVNGGFAAIVDPAGQVVSSHSFGLFGDLWNLNHTSDVDLGPDGRLAVSGEFSGVADLGDGPVDTGVDPPSEGFAGFIAVYEPERPSVD
jgi:outer membrane protein assembly factor BamB